MTDASLQQDLSLDALVAQVADEFLERRRRGEQPDVEEYATRHPQSAEVLRKVLASLQLLDFSSRACTTRTSCRCSASAASAACTSTPCSLSTARRWPP